MIDKNYLPECNSWEYIVPPGIRYLSDWKDFDFTEFPFKCIIDKQIPGCGYTEWAINNSYNVILASPRKMLLENKADQHPGEVFLVKNELDRDPGVDKNLNNTNKINPNSKATSEKLTQELLIEKLGFSTPDTYNRLRSEFLSYLATRGNQPIKVLVTYDSYYIMKAILEDLGIFSTFFTVVDEYQSVLVDSRFKSTAEFEFMEVLKTVQYVHFVSATPMLEKYTKDLDDFKDLPMYKLNWGKADPGRVVRPNLKVLLMKSVGEVLPGIIKKYLAGNFESIVVGAKEIISKEAVFYVNSVNHIITMISRCDLQPDQVNILCARTPENESKLKKKLGKGFSIGSIPTKGQPHKMFTFCTRTVYLGADFYSTNARTFIFSDANSDCLAVDISQDLPQILGRQRLPENPWKNSATFYYRATADYKGMKKADFDKIIEAKDRRTENLLTNYRTCCASGNDIKDLIDTFRSLAKVYAYKNDYVSVSTKTGSVVVVCNDYVRVSDKRAFDIQQVDYADRFSVFRELESKIVGDSSGAISGLMKEYLELSDNISKRIKFLCDLNPEFEQLFLDNLTNSDYAKSYYLQLGRDKCKSLGYDVWKIRKVLGIKNFNKENLALEIYQRFKVGDRVIRSEAKTILQQIYDSFQYEKKAKASDLDEYFETKACRVGKDYGLNLIKQK